MAQYYSAEEMKDKFMFATPEWAVNVINSFKQIDSAVDVVDEIVAYAMVEQDRYFKTPSHPEELTESEVLYCLARGVQLASQKYAHVVSPFDRPGLTGPMSAQEFMIGVFGMLQTERGFAGFDPEPRPTRTQSTTPGPYPWSFARG